LEAKAPDIVNPSFKVAALDPGEEYVIENFDGRHNLQIKFTFLHRQSLIPYRFSSSNITSPDSVEANKNRCDHHRQNRTLQERSRKNSLGLARLRFAALVIDTADAAAMVTDRRHPIQQWVPAALLRLI